MKIATTLFILCSTVLKLSFAFPLSSSNNRPIIGVLTEPTEGSQQLGQEYIHTTYVHYLEMAGARVVPVRGKQPKEYYKALFNNINGVFFPGGAADLMSGPYAQSGRYLYDLAIQANDRGDYFPIWGTCLGLELLTVLTAKKNYLKNTDTDNMTLPLRLEKGFDQSRLFKDMPVELIKIISTEPVTQNNHIWSLLTEDYKNIPVLNTFYQVLSTNVGRDNKEFVSTFEGFKYPFYGVQWHPEKNVFFWPDNQVINHDSNAIKVSQYFANFFVDEARKSSHHFNSSDTEARAVIENALRVFVPNFNVYEDYLFNYTNNYFTNKFSVISHG
ncbi:gamma-glutamyl hydrolase [Biomphalaria glabrata]|nr:gamma-glutamyl hydrolase [Biomphalaria glabrata]